MNKSTEYNKDFYAWTLHNAKLMQARKVGRSRCGKFNRGS